VYPEVSVEPTKLLIGSEWVSAANGKDFSVTNPSNTKEITTSAYGEAADIDHAVKSARKAYEGAWSALKPRERSKLIYRLADLIERDQEKLAVLESMDNGKPIRETLAFDLPQVIDTFRYYAGWADKIDGHTNSVSGDFLCYTLKEPAGVVGQIIPWNFPLLMAAWKLAPAFATGCTSVLKPAEQTPLTAIELGKLVLEAGFPPGVLNIVTGDGVAGAALASHPGIDKIAFTGSTDVGRKVMMAAAQNLKRVSLELGGKAPNIVFSDADIDKAVSGAITGIFFNQGEVCCAGSRLFLHENIKDQFIEKFVSAAENIKVGNPLDDTTQMGAQVSNEQYEKIIGFIESVKDSDATLKTGGKGLKNTLGGYFIKPTLFTDTSTEAKIYREEIFGPVLCARTFDNEEELIEQAHNTNYGLSAGIWTKDISKAHRFARKIHAGTVWVNCYNAFDVAMPFGGFKDSGFGRELGKQALELYTGEKAVWVAL